MLSELRFWNKESKNKYLYVISDSFAYEIRISSHINGDEDEDVILNATASLYLTYIDLDTNDFFEELIAKNKTVRECIEIAYKNIECNDDYNKLLIRAGLEPWTD